MADYTNPPATVSRPRPHQRLATRCRRTPLAQQAKHRRHHQRIGFTVGAVPHNQLQGDDREQIHELYARYAWGIDLADWALLSDSFSADARTDLTPMGKRSGHREVYGQLRGFREATGELWHAATALDIRFTDDGQRADILLGRTISEQAFNTDGQALYGAHYKAQAVRGSDGVWRYAIFEYTPGWFVYNEAV